MQGEPVQFGAVAASRAKRSAAGFTQPIRGTHKAASDAKTATIQDAAFADFTRIDAGTEISAANSKSVPQNWPSMTQTLIADIATQLETLDSQRRRLARLLESVDTNPTV